MTITRFEPGKRLAGAVRHNDTVYVAGQVADTENGSIEVQTREMLWMRDRIEEIYVEHTTQDRAQVHRDIERDRFMGPVEAVDYGLIDRIYTFRDEANAAARQSKQAAGF